MKFGTIGAGAVALAFAREALAAGHDVVLRQPARSNSLGGKVADLGRGASGRPVEVAASLDYVLLAVPWPNVEDALRGLPAWNGRVLIDATNPFSEYSPNLVLADLGGKGASEIVAGSRAGRPRRQGIQLDHYRTFQRGTHEEQRPSRDFYLGRRARTKGVHQ